MPWSNTSTHQSFETGPDGAIEAGPFFDDTTLATNVHFTFKYIHGSDDPEEVLPPFELSRYEWAITPANYDNNTWEIYTSDGTLHIKADNIASIFPVEYIRYMDNGGKIYKISGWHELPDVYEELIEAKPNMSVSETWTISVTAVNKHTKHENYSTSETILVWQDWQGITNKIKEAMGRAIGYKPKEF